MSQESARRTDHHVDRLDHSQRADRDGDYRDVTPKPWPEIERVLFLADPALEYEGRQIDNVRVALVDDPLVHDFIATAEAFFQATNRGELADYHWSLRLTPEMKRLVERRERLGLEIVAKYYSRFLPEGRTRFKIR